MISFFDVYSGKTNPEGRIKVARVEVRRITGLLLFQADFYNPTRALELFNELSPEKEPKIALHQLTLFDLSLSGFARIKAQINLADIRDDTDVMFRECEGL